MTNVEPATGTPKSEAAGPRAVDWANPRVAAILSAAAKCFARGGFSATTLAEIGKELGLRKSIVHYYFASKAALIHEVQSFTYQKYLSKVKDAVAGTEAGPSRTLGVVGSLWNAIRTDPTLSALNIEVWSAARRDDELKRRASELQREASTLIDEAVRDAVNAGAQVANERALSTLIGATLNGLSVADYLDPGADADGAYAVFQKMLGRELGATAAR
jgi:AcrR family transcriptional regulator